MENKPYVEPQTKVVEVDDVEIICTSTQTDSNYFRIKSDTGYTEEDW